MTRIIVAILALGCRGGDEPATCGPGQFEHEDGTCADVEDTGTEEDTGTPAEEPPTLEDVLDALEDCEGLDEPDGRMSIVAGCADGACAKTTYTAFVDALGAEGECSFYYYESDSYEYGYASCGWETGIYGSFDDEDRDGVVDPDSYTWGVYLGMDYEGVSAEGLSVGLPFDCFVEVLGHPDSVTFSELSGGWTPTRMSWDDLGLYVYDSYDNKTSAYGSDGRSDYIYLYGVDGGW